MALPTLSSQELNTVYTAHAEKFLRTKLADGFYKRTPTLAWLRKNKKTDEGGLNLICPLLNGLEPTGGAVERTSNITLRHHEVVTQARFEWCTYHEDVLIYRHDEIRAKGMGRKLDMVESQTTGCFKRLQRKLAQAVFATAPASYEMQGLMLLAPTAFGSSYGNIDPAQQTWWKSKLKTGVGAFATNGLPAMRELWNLCTEGADGEEPDFIVCSEDIYRAYEALISAKHSVWSEFGKPGAQEADLGIGKERLWFKGCPVYWDPYLPNIADGGTGDMFFLNSNCTQLVEMPNAMKLEPFQSSLGSGGPLARGTVMLWDGQLGCYNRRGNGRLTGITV